MLDIHRTLGQLNNTISAQTVHTQIETFDGINSEKCKAWFKSLEKIAVLNDMDDSERIKTAFMTARGAVSDFIFRFHKDPEYPFKTWGALKSALTTRFASVTDTEHASALLRTIKQGPEQSIQMYVEQIYNLAEICFEGLEGEGAQEAIERSMIGYFVDGLYDSGLKLKLIRENPHTFEKATKIALEEQNVRKRFALRNGNKQGAHRSQASEPMEVDHTRYPRRCHICNKTNHSAKNCLHRQREVNMIKENNEQWRAGNPIVCWHCNEPNHIRRFCPKLQQYSRDDMSRKQRQDWGRNKPASETFGWGRNSNKSSENWGTLQ